MSTLRAVAAAPLAFAYWLGLAGRAARTQGDDFIFFYHGTPREHAGELARQLRYLRREFRIVPLADLVGSLAGGEPRESQRRAAVTFDDGLRSNVRVGYPILRRLGIPATFFVCPGLIDEGRWLWPHEARCRLRSLPAGPRQELACELGAPSAIEPFVRWMKSLQVDARLKVEARIREATPGFAPTPAERDAFDLAGWDELRALDPDVITVASHTMTHPVLPGLGQAQLEWELGESRRAIEARLQRATDLFCYPNGDLNAEALACARRHYRAAVTCDRAGIPPAPDLHQLPRFSVPPGALRLAWSLHGTVRPGRPAPALRPARE